MKGKKTCPNCQTMNGCRSCSCSCGHVFREKKPPKIKTINNSNNEKRGRKICVCGVFCGVRTLVCKSCYNVFPVKTQKNEIQKEQIQKPIPNVEVTPNEDGLTHEINKEIDQETDQQSLLANMRKEFPGYRGGNVIYTPGESYYSNKSICPINTKDFENIEDWCQAMYDHACQNGFYYAACALKYLAKKYYSKEDLVKIDKFYESMRQVCV